MKSLLPLSLILVFTMLAPSNAQGQEAKLVPVNSLTSTSSVQERIDNLKAKIDYNSLRRRRYGWVYPGRWEVGLHFMPWVSSSTNFARILSENATDAQSSTTINLGEEGNRTFFQQRNEFVEVGSRPGVVFLNADVVRQFSSGWRLGVGYTMYNVVYSRPLQTEEVAEVVAPDEYGLFYSTSQRQHFISAEAGFTFCRRRRFRPSLSLSAVRAGDFITRGRSTLINGEDQSIVFDREEVRRDQNNFRSVYLMARLGLQYQLSLHATLGLEIGLPLNSLSYVGAPLVGVGGRYTFGWGL